MVMGWVVVDCNGRVLHGDRCVRHVLDSDAVVLHGDEWVVVDGVVLNVDGVVLEVDRVVVVDGVGLCGVRG